MTSFKAGSRWRLSADEEKHVPAARLAVTESVRTSDMTGQGRTVATRPWLFSAECKGVEGLGGGGGGRYKGTLPAT